MTSKNHFFDFSKKTILEKNNIIEYLSQFVTQHKLDLMDKVLTQRTKHITVVLEDIYQPHNASAVIRSCECFGVQDIHIIENKNQYQINPDVVMGSSKWITLHRYNQAPNNTMSCLSALKKQGYQIVATTLDQNSIPLEQLQITQKTALCFDTEEFGISNDVYQTADKLVHIPMVGFTQSFNISVSVALCLFALTNYMKQNLSNWQLGESEQIDLKIQWMLKTIKNGELILKQFIE